MPDKIVLASMGDEAATRADLAGRTFLVTGASAGIGLATVRALARRLKGTGITANAMHPGFVATEIFGKGGGPVGLAASLYSKLRGLSPEQGADTVVWLAASPEVEGRSGLYWINRQERPCPFHDEGAEEALWALCRDMLLRVRPGWVKANAQDLVRSRPVSPLRGPELLKSLGSLRNPRVLDCPEPCRPSSSSR